MDRVARAIEIARQGAQAESSPAAPRLREPARQVPPSQVAYTRSRANAVSSEALRRRHITGGHERTPLAEAFKRLRTRLLQRMREGGGNSLGIASARAGEGKTTVALNLAVHASMESDWTVLLVDTDMRSPGLCAALGVDPLPGLADFLLEEAPLEDLLVHPGLGRCLLLPAGRPPANPSELLGSARMHELATELKRRYPDRLVIFDLPPLLDSADGIAALPWVEALLLVVEEGRSATEDVLRAAQLAGDARLIGTLLNKSRA
jgi:Mrp family chromosome partitioning ATPase